ncbi:MAG: peptide chain release factor N(5)-glutamine methyltransferase [Hyphomonadaceae bacterium]
MSVHCTWQDVMRDAAARLQAAGVEGAWRDVRLLLAHALGVEPVDVILREKDDVEPVGLTAFEAAVQRREAGEPVSRIQGWREFYGRRFHVTPDVLDPRPETELLVDIAIARLPRDGRVLDLGVGSGCILLSVLAERTDSSGVGVDISAAALGVARINAEALAVLARAELVQGGWDATLSGAFDLVLSNPPYIPAAEMEGLAREVINHDPHLALTPGGDGLGPYRAILARVSQLLAPGGWIGFEFGLGQSLAVSDLMAQAGLQQVEVLSDLAGIERAAFGRRAAGAP